MGQNTKQQHKEHDDDDVMTSMQVRRGHLNRLKKFGYATDSMDDALANLLERVEKCEGNAAP